ncbi:MAG: sensor histidine kinase, partial [Bacteroidia bacterium]
NKLTLQFLGIVATILLGSLLSIFYLSQRYREQAFFNRLNDKAITYVELRTKNPEMNQELVNVIERANKDVLFKEFALIFNDLNELVASNGDTASMEFEIPAVRINEVRLRGEIRYNEKLFDVIGKKYTDRMNNQFIVFVGGIDIFGQDELKNLQNILIIVFFVVSLAAAVSGWLFAGRALKPISAVINQVDNISASNLNQRLAVGTQTDEIARLAATFNKMLDRIESAFKIQKTFVANASHELKNMLTVITAQLEVSMMKERSLGEYQHTLQSVTEDIKNLNGVSNRLLELAKLSAEETITQFDLIRIDELLWQARSEILKRHTHNKVSFIIEELPEEEEKLYLKGSETLLKTAFLNLMENACKFSPNREVIVSLSINEKAIVIAFADKGIGIPEGDLQMIFEPFHRGKNTLNIRGHGIGLSLVDRIIKLHNGLIKVQSKLGEGTTFTITFPFPKPSKKNEKKKGRDK